MDVRTAFAVIEQALAFDSGKFYAPPGDLPLGSGLLYSDIPYPVYLPEDELYGTQVGPVYVLTHECDTDRNNQRIFNDRLLICPIIELSSFVRIYSQVDEGKLRNFLVALGRREVYRVIYLPHYSPYLPYGGLLYFNFIANSAPSAFQRNPLATVTYYGLNIIDQAVRNHLLRPKNASLPLEHY